MQLALLESQRIGGCEDGSWDSISQWGDRGGRVYSTALAAMTLEVYCRFVHAQVITCEDRHAAFPEKATGSRRGT